MTMVLRGAIAVAVALVVAACSSDGVAVLGTTTLVEPTTTTAQAPATTTTEAPTTTTTAAPTTTTIPTLAAVEPFEPAETDVLKDRKRLGGQFAQALLTYDADATVEAHVQALIDRYGVLSPTGMVELTNEAMAPGEQSVATVRYAQMGGNRLTLASLMVWVDVERLSADGLRTTESRVVDVRVRLVNSEWTVDRLASAGGPAVERPGDLSDLAVSVVDHANISMPDSARWDIYSGHTTDAMLRRMVEVAALTDYAVLVLSRGHPYHVFETQSVSRHSVGQAMDVYEVGGQLVVDSRDEDSPTWKLARALFDNGIGSIGSPWAFDGYRGRSFTDDVHQDHLHITSL